MFLDGREVELPIESGPLEVRGEKAQPQAMRDQTGARHFCVARE